MARGNPNWAGGKSGNPAGKPKGTPNRDTAEMRAAWLAAFKALQEGPHNLIDWGSKNPTEFYKVSKTLIPNEIVADVTSAGEAIGAIVVKIVNAENAENGEEKDGEGA